MDRQLIDYLPPAVAEIRDFRALMDAAQVEVDEAYKKEQQDFDNNFIETTNEKGIERYEAMLKVKPKATDDLQLRRFRVLSKYNAQLPYTFLKLIEMLQALCGEDGVKVVRNGLALTVKVELTAKGMVDEVRNILMAVRPANMVIDLTLLYNQWGSLKAKRWQDVSSKTWSSLRNEVI